ncbi:hypothetical protein J6590_069861 [Homalodisca vitripennis]|nr:hypothetical protein J6590_069861 [Homalodisca vitripennis]
MIRKKFLNKNEGISKILTYYGASNHKFSKAFRRWAHSTHRAAGRHRDAFNSRLLNGNGQFTV